MECRELILVLTAVTNRNGFSEEHNVVQSN